MFEDLLQIFTDRREAIALFDIIRRREPHQHTWPLLPILTFIAQGGSGKSTLIEYLISGRCCENGRAILPYAHIDFTDARAPKDPLSILIELRDQLQSHADENGKHITFPRFDLGAAITINASIGSSLPTVGKDEIRRILKVALPIFQSIDAIGNSLGYLNAFIPVLMVALRLALSNVKPLRDILYQLEYKSNWQWYLTSEADIGLKGDVGVDEVLLRLYNISISSRSGKEGRTYLVNHILPAAFIADLLDALNGSNNPRTWNSATNIVVFLDGLEVLLADSSNADFIDPSNVGLQLLEFLALTEHRTRGKTDPLLLVIGSRQRLLKLTDAEQHLPFEQTKLVDNGSLKELASEIYGKWYNQLPSDKRYLLLKDLYLPMLLLDFGEDDTYYYLSQIDKQEPTPAFASKSLVQAIHRVTHGHPLYLALAAAAVLASQAHGRKLTPDEFEQAHVSPKLASGHEDENIRDFLLSLFLSQLSKDERERLIFCAAPRFLDADTLKALLQLPNDIVARNRWSRYRSLTFVRAIDDHRLVFHPLVRELLLKELPANRDSGSDYYQVHTLLRAHFHSLAMVEAQGTPTQRKGSEQARIEEAYHALALGDSEPALSLALAAQNDNTGIWELILEAVAQAPTELIPLDTMQRANEAAERVIKHREMRDGVVAIVLYRWLLTASKDKVEAALILHRLGIAFGNLRGGDKLSNLQKAIACYQEALQTRTQDAYPVDWAATQNNLGIAYRELPGGDRQTNLQKAIECFQKALQIRTRNAYPVDWAMTQHNLGNIYSSLPRGDRRVNLQMAITSYKETLTILTLEAYPYFWAMAQHSLGSAYSNLLSKDWQVNLGKAIECYQKALQIYTQEAYPYFWAMVQHSLGLAYSNLLNKDWQVNLEKAIECYQKAQEVYTQEAYPVDWAATQNNLGNIYRIMLSEDRQANFMLAIAFYQKALMVFIREDFPVEWAMVQDNLGSAYRDLPSGNRQDNLNKAVAYYQAALQIRTREVLPADWADTQYQLGKTYSLWVEGNQRENLEKAIGFYQAALDMYNSMHIDTYAQEVEENLEKIKDELRDLIQNAK